MSTHGSRRDVRQTDFGTFFVYDMLENSKNDVYFMLANVVSIYFMLVKNNGRFTAK